MGFTDLLDGQDLTMRQIGYIVVGWLLLVSLISVGLLIYTRTLIV